MVNGNDIPTDHILRFLKNGNRHEWSAKSLADACSRLVRTQTQKSAPEAVAMARSFLERSSDLGDFARPIALRALGWALQVSGQYKEAEKRYLEARSLLRRDVAERSKIDRILIDVYMYLGNFEESRRRANLALAGFRKLGADSDIAKTNVNYANVLHRLDRHREAHRRYTSATKYFKNHGPEPAYALCLYNQANTHVQLFDFEAASEAYSTAREICLRYDFGLLATSCLYGMAWLHMLRGDFHVALKELNECETKYAEGGQPREQLLCELDRAEAYLGLNLFSDALESARQATASATELGIKYELGKAGFFEALALSGLGRVRESHRPLKTARDCFSSINNQGFLGAVDLTRSGLASGDRTREFREAHRRFQKAQLPLWAAICDLQIATSPQGSKEAMTRLSRNPAVKAVPHLLARYHTLKGDRHASSNRNQEAIRHWTIAAEVLDAVRAKLPPVELRSAFLTSRSDPYKNLVESQASSSPREAAVWSERLKTAGLWSSAELFDSIPPTRQRVQDSLAVLAQQVAALSHRIPEDDKQRSFGPQKTTAGVKEMRQVVRQTLASVERGQLPSSKEAVHESIERVSKTSPILQLYVGDTDIIAFIHDRGECRSVRYREGVTKLRNLAAQWRYMVECLPVRRGRWARAERADENRILHQISEWILRPLELNSRRKNLLIVPEGQLWSLPWMALSSSAGVALGESHRVVLAPSIRHFAQSMAVRTSSQKVRVFVGDSAGLPFLNQEIEAVESQMAGKNTKTVRPCRRKDWPIDSSFRAWHFAGHASLRVENPFYSSLQLEDGPLFAADLRVRRNRVKLVTLAACRTGQQTGLPSEEVSGLVRSFLEMGARTVVAGNWAVHDESTAHWMRQFYKGFRIHKIAAKAVQEASLATREKYGSAYHWAAFSAHGAP